jgi:hypothetical protein
MHELRQDMSGNVVSLVLSYIKVLPHSALTHTDFQFPGNVVTNLALVQGGR